MLPAVTPALGLGSAPVLVRATRVLAVRLRIVAALCCCSSGHGVSHCFDANQIPDFLHSIDCWASFAGSGEELPGCAGIPANGFLDFRSRNVGPLLFFGASGCVVVLQLLCLELVQSQPGGPLPVFGQVESMSVFRPCC